uniref:Helix-turn-helix domain-containing protein n=1 Tax=candidate division CPR3 bacterium TaxID=2268181 RepID=A0A7V3JAL1_UNCC3
MKLPFSFLPIPEEIMRDKSLSFGAKYLFGIFSKINKEKVILRIRYLAKRMGCSMIEAQRRITELKKKGFIIVIPRPGRANEYQINFELVQIIQTPIQTDTPIENQKGSPIESQKGNNKENINKERDKSLQPDGCERGVDENSLKKLDKLVGSYKPKEDLRIVFAYAQAIGKNFSNNKEKQSFISRNIRAARLLLGYPIKKVEIWCKILPYLELKKWTLETVGKFIDEDPIDTIMRYREKDYDDVFRELEEEKVVKWDNKEGWKLNL